MENLKKEIEQLKKERNAVLLAHYYVDDAVQEIADYVGDSYYLAKVALKESKDVICFAGVNFMGESAMRILLLSVILTLQQRSKHILMSV